MSKPLNDIVKEARINLLKMFYQSRTGHLASALSCLEILTTLYFYKPNPLSKIILSKGHGAGALYVVLEALGVISRKELGTFYGYDSKLLALASPTIPGIEIPTGSLGQGIGFSVGIAMSYQTDAIDAPVYCVIGDGEMQEGSIWEAALIAGNRSLKNLVIILDNNKIQASNRTEEISPIMPIIDKWVTFGFDTFEINGHSIDEITTTIDEIVAMNSQKPKFICANTIKGHGISFIANKDQCHMRNPKGDEWLQVCDELGIAYEEMGVL